MGEEVFALAIYTQNANNKGAFGNMNSQIHQLISIQAFQKACFRGRVHRLISRIKNKAASLLLFDNAVNEKNIIGRHYAGLKTVALNQIRGTLGKENEFDDEFNPMEERIAERWTRLAEKKLEGYDLPPVELLQAGETYFVSDGHHRISVSRALGQNFIDAEVIVLNINGPFNIR